MKTVDQNTYYFDKSSYKAVKGWQFINGTTYYFDENGCMLKDGIYEIDGNNYYFYPSGKMGKGYIKPYYFDPVTGAQVTGFVNTNGYTYYFTKEGVLTGLQNIDGKLYYFNSNGVMQRGFQKITVDGVATRYYFDPSTGEALTGIATSNGNIYYFDGANGSISGLATVDGVVHNFLSDTTASKSCIKIIDSVGYYFDANGEQRCGFITNNGYEYYFYPNGGYASKTSEKNAISEELDSAEDGFVTVSGVTYYKEYGSLVKGFRTIDGDVYYFAEDNGEMLTGLRTIDGDCYYFSEDGVMQTGAVTLEGGVSYFGEDGKRLSGAVEGSYYNQLGQKRSGIISDSGKLYSYNDNVVSGFVTTDSGLMCYVEDNEIQTGLIDIDGSEYYFDTQGVMQSGMITVDGVSMYFDPDTGARLFGFVERNGKTFYMDREKGMLTGLVEIDGDTYYFDYLGVMSTGMVSIDSDSYYFNNGTGNLLTGWIDDGGDLLYADTETGILKKGIAEIDGNSFYFNTTSCRMMTGWVSDGDNLYYFDNEGIRQTGFTVVGERTYYLGESGYLTGLNEINGETYYFNDYGVMLTGEQTIDGKAYYFDRTTGRRLTGLIRNGKYYYGYLEEGGLASGIATLSDGKTYYFKETNNAAEFGLRSFEDGKLYYFDEEEGMRKDTSWETEGITYTADSDGVITMTADSDNKVAQMICAGAKYLGTTYGSGDGQLVCSSFVTEALKSIGVELTGTAAIQYSLLFDDENVQEFYYFDDLKAGDIVFYVNGDCGDGETCGCIGEIHHVGIYMGNGTTIEATSMSIDEETGEKSGYTLIRNIQNSDSICIVMVARIQY
jgi:glucan-binding YG repeat protein